MATSNANEDNENDGGNGKSEEDGNGDMGFGGIQLKGNQGRESKLWSHTGKSLSSENLTGQ